MITGQARASRARGRSFVAAGVHLEVILGAKSNFGHGLLLCQWYPPSGRSCDQVVFGSLPIGLAFALLHFRPLHGRALFSRCARITSITESSDRVPFSGWPPF